MAPAQMAASGLMAFLPVHIGAVPPIGSNMLTPCGINVAARRDAQAALGDGGKVGDDVAEHVLGDDDVEHLGARDHVEAGGVHVVVFPLHVRVLGADLGEHAVPELVHVGEHVGLAHQGELVLRAHAARLLAVRARVFKGVAEAALHLLIGVYHVLDRDFVIRAGARQAAHAGIHAAAVLADAAVIDLLRALVLDGAFHAGIEAHGPEVDVLVQLEAELQENALFQYPRLHVRVADGAEVDGVEFL